MVAAGQLTPTTRTAVHVWDWAAGALIAAEAGARCLRLPPADGGAGVVVAAAPGIADALLAGRPEGIATANTRVPTHWTNRLPEWIFFSSVGSAG